MSLPYVSAGYDELYRDIGYGIDDRDGGLLAETSPDAFNIRRMARIYDHEDYAWTVDTSLFLQQSPFTEQLTSFYRTISSHRCPAALLVSVDNAAVSGSVVYCARRNDPEALGILYETHLPPDRPAVSLASPTALAQKDSRTFQDPAANYLHLSSAGSFNYGHFLVDDLPRAIAALKLQRLDPSRRVEIVAPAYNSLIDDIRREALRALLGPAIRVSLYDRSTIYGFHRLHYCTPVSLHPIRKMPSAIQFVSSALAHPEKIIGRQENIATGGARLFISRENGDGRLITNRTAVQRLLDEFGFETIRPAALTFADQVRKFACAEIVLGTMGAGMCNSIFCPPGCRLLYLAPEGWIEPFYFDLATVRGQRYQVLFGPGEESGLPAYLRNFEVPIDLLANALQSYESN